MKAKHFANHLDDDRIAEAIRQAELQTSGEIRVFLSKNACTEPLEDARREFHRLQMQTTPQRNAVLLYFAPVSQRFAIFGDEGIHLRCGQEFWTAVTAEMEPLLRESKFTEAVLAGIQRAGQQLARHFPKHSVDRDDLPNTVVRD